ncbi:hypothetical protein [Flavobacterium gawalongense]|uniref:hypothetical protein n=1 Tax=Flavobacterium gawalongense TaxID=2594432 RepID=UPI001F35E5B5|nr:hypothetical protein [Flavobacterium gawalongense]
MARRFSSCYIRHFRKNRTACQLYTYNPVEAEIVFNERDYVNSSYGNYEEDNTVFCNINVEPLW